MRSRVDIKTEAKEILRSAKVSPILITLIVMAIAFVLNRVMILVEYGTLFPSALSSAMPTPTSRPSPRGTCPRCRLWRPPCRRAPPCPSFSPRLSPCSW